MRGGEPQVGFFDFFVRFELFVLHAHAVRFVQSRGRGGCGHSEVQEGVEGLCDVVPRGYGVTKGYCGRCSVAAESAMFFSVEEK